MKEQAFSKTIKVINILCQDISALEKVSKDITDVAAVIATFRNTLGKAIVDIDDSGGKVNSLLVDNLLIISADNAFTIQIPEYTLQCPVGNAVKYNFSEAPEIVQLDKDGDSLEISIVPNDYLSQADQRFVTAIHFLISSFNENQDDKETANKFVELLVRMYEFCDLSDSEKEEKIKEQHNKVNRRCFLSDMMCEALNNIKIPKANEESLIEFIQLTKLEFEKNKEIDFRDFVISYQKAANYYNFIQKHKRTNILFTYDSELDYLFITDKNTDKKYNKEDYEGEAEYQKILVVEGLLKSIAGKIKAKEFFDSIS